MKYSFFVLLAVLLFAFGVGCAKVEPLTTKTFPQTKVASLSMQGPYTKMNDAFVEIGNWLTTNKIAATGAPIGIFYDDPAKVAPDSLRWEICFPIGELPMDTVKKVPLPIDTTRIKIKELPSCEVASIIHTGSYEKIGDTYKKIYTLIQKNKYEATGAPMEVFLQNPSEVPAESLKTEILIPIKKK
uniref:GyrI-like domain-containing protein n=1 Tax=candidate division WOR-3 bacterium TaxID=2052148 RepID=A0A7C4Y4A0_UNCW3